MTYSTVHKLRIVRYHTGVLSFLHTPSTQSIFVYLEPLSIELERLNRLVPSTVVNSDANGLGILLAKTSSLNPDKESTICKNMKTNLTLLTKAIKTYH